MPKSGKINYKDTALDVLFDLMGCSFLAVGITCFSSPYNIAPGGVSGISILVNYLTAVPISALTMLFNIPLLILGWIFLGRSFTVKTMKSVVILSLMLQLVSMTRIVYTGNTLLAALYGGVIGGIGIAFVFMRASTTGGSDIASRLLQLKLPGFSVGKLILALDACVLISAAFVYGNIENALYGLISTFASTTVIDSLLYGLDTGKLMMIMTVKPDEITAEIANRLARSSTILTGKGSFTQREQPVIFCVVRKGQYFELKRLVHEQDPAAFMVALDASEIIGMGFKDISRSTQIT